MMSPMAIRTQDITFLYLIQHPLTGISSCLAFAYTELFGAFIPVVKV